MGQFIWGFIKERRSPTPASSTGKWKWRTAGDDRVRETHQHVEGEVREQGKEFSNGLRYPGDPLGPPGEVINCRCHLEEA